MILLQKAKIYDIRSSRHLKKMDILIDKGIIKEISKNITAPKKAKVISSKDLSVSPGWVDIGSYNGEPGYEYREDLDSLRDAAAMGGYCGIAPFPTGKPTIDSKGQLLFLRSRSKDEMVDIYPIAALTKGRGGKDLAELLDLHNSGAIAFSDGDSSQLGSDQLLRSLLYLKSINALTIYNPFKTGEGQVNEGPISVQMGMEGIPQYEEESFVHTAIKHSEYAEARVLIHNISTTAGIKEARGSSNKKNISFSIPFMNLISDDSDLLTFDLNLKVSPPLRGKSEKRGLTKAIESGQVNIISSNHRPLSIEEKDQPFGLTKFGASTLEVVFSALNTYANGLSTERIIHCLSNGPKEALELVNPDISKNEYALLTVFDPSDEIKYEDKDLKSKSKNNPFLGQPLKGRVLGIINGNRSNL